MIKLSKSSISKVEEKLVQKVLRSEYLGMGKQVSIFEKKIENFFSRPCVCVNSGTSALQIALFAIGIKSGDEIIVPSLTYVASFQSISALGAVPVACDVTLDDLTIDIIDLKKKITKKTKAIMFVHYAGGYNSLNKLYKIARQKKLRIIEDAAHAFGNRFKDGKKVGSFGDVVCFSFDGIKNITTGEGGCIITKDKKVLKAAKNARLLGVENETSFRFKNQRQWNFDVKNQGWRSHMSNILAAIGIGQLKRFNYLANTKKKLANYYDSKLRNEKNIILLNRNYHKIVPHIYPIRVKNLKDRKKLQVFLIKKGIQIGYHYQPNHLLSFFLNKIKNKNLKNTDILSKELISLPLHADLKLKELDYIVNIIKKNLAKFITKIEK